MEMHVKGKNYANLYFVVVIYRYVTTSNRICLLDKHETKNQFIPQDGCILDILAAMIQGGRQCFTFCIKSIFWTKNIFTIDL